MILHDNDITKQITINTHYKNIHLVLNLYLHYNKSNIIIKNI